MIIANGSADVTTYWVLRDSTTHAPKTSVTITDIDVYYVEAGAAITAKADLTALAAADSAHADSKGYEIGQGLYRIDWPDEAFNGGVGKIVTLIVVCAGVDTTYLDVELSPTVDVHSISADTTAADTLELQFDGTGISGATYPATQQQAGSIAVASAAINTVATGATVTQGAETLDYTSTHSLDGTAHSINDSASGIDVVYRFSVGSSGIPVSCKAIVALTGNADVVTVKAYNWGTSGYDTIGSITGTSGVTYQTKTFDLITAHVGTGANVGAVDIQFYAATDQTAVLYLDQLLVSYAQAATGIANGSTVTLGASTTNTDLIGQSWSLALGAQTISGSYFEGAKSVTGTGVSTNGAPPWFNQCVVGTATLSADAYIENCQFKTTLTLASTAGVTADTLQLLNCTSVGGGTSPPTIDASALSKSTGINIRNWDGGITLTQSSYCTTALDISQGGTVTITTGGGVVKLRGICEAVAITCSGTSTSVLHGVFGTITVAGTGGTVNISGVHGVITDSSGGAVTINDLGATASTIANTGEAMTLAAGAITSTVIATGAVDADALAADAATEIADAILGRDLGSGSNAGVAEERTVRSALRFLRNKWSVAGTTLTVTVEDDTTAAWTSALTSSASADPVTASDPT